MEGALALGVVGGYVFVFVYLCTFICVFLFVYLYLCTCICLFVFVFVYLTVGNISFDVLGPWAFQKYSSIRFSKIFWAW